MNITEYFAEEDKNPPVYRGKMSLKENYTIADADESLYRYLGDNSALPITSLIHPDDVESFCDALSKLKEQEQRVIVRLQCSNGNYRYMYMILSYNGRMMGEFASIDIDVLDIMRIHYKFDNVQERLLKYRKQMSLGDKLYFDYFYQSGEMVIYEYVLERSVVLFRGNISDVEERVTREDVYTDRQRAEFQSLRNSLLTSQENIELEIDGELFGLPGKYLKMRGGLLYREKSKKMMSAVITIRREMEEEEKYYMTPYSFDNATGVYNKRAITELAKDLVVDGGEHHSLFLCVADIDEFKGVNDTFGHMVGDEVIAKVAETFRSVLGHRGYVGRFGGDEFLIVADRVGSVDELIYVFKTIRKNIAWSCATKIGGRTLTTSIGIAKYPEHGTTFEELFNIADKCLYLAKAKGRNRFIIYTPELHGSPELPDEDGRNTQGFAKESYMGDYKVITDMLAQVANDNPEAFRECLKEICRCYCVDGVNIYMGESYQRSYSAGVCHGIAEGAAFVEDPRMCRLFDSNGVLALNKVIALKAEVPEVYDRMVKEQIEGFAYVKVTRPNGLKALVAFDVQNRRRKWAENDKGLLLIAAGTIVDWYLLLADQPENTVWSDA